MMWPNRMSMKRRKNPGAKNWRIVPRAPNPLEP